jgi:protocatechuate 3,4-dioxygenase alpha subunit
MAKLVPTGSSTVGPYLHVGLTWLTTQDIAGTAGGKRIRVTGKIVDGDGKVVPDAIVEVWQANPQGKYAHPEDKQDKPVDDAFKGWGRCPTDKNGMFEFTTLKPGAVPGPGNTLQAPHLAITIFMRGQLKQLYTRMYFADEAGNANDPILNLVEDKARRDTLIARTDGEGRYRWDVVLQGKNETVFFDC